MGYDEGIQKELGGVSREGPSVGTRQPIRPARRVQSGVYPRYRAFETRQEPSDSPENGTQGSGGFSETTASEPKRDL